MWICTKATKFYSFDKKLVSLLKIGQDVLQLYLKHMNQFIVIQIECGVLVEVERTSVGELSPFPSNQLLPSEPITITMVTLRKKGLASHFFGIMNGSLLGVFVVVIVTSIAANCQSICLWTEVCINTRYHEWEMR